MISELPPSYLYSQYRDDANMQAFRDSYNDLVLTYLQWFNDNPLAVYSQSTISGSLLDWVGRSIYQISRPVLSTTSTIFRDSLISLPLIARPLPDSVVYQTGGSQLVSDDVYKRMLTWILYRGDGVNSSLSWLRRRVARFLYGSNGANCDPSDYLSVYIKYTPVTTHSLLVGSTNSGMTNSSPTNALYSSTISQGGNTTIAVPPTGMGPTFQKLFQEGVLPVPFQSNISVWLLSSDPIIRIFQLTGAQGAYYDISDRSTLFQDAAGTTPVTAVGQPVGLVLDKSGNGNHASQSTTASCPIYQIDANGFPNLGFDGVDDSLNADFSSFPTGNVDLTAVACWALSAYSSGIGGIIGIGTESSNANFQLCYTGNPGQYYTYGYGNNESWGEGVTALNSPSVAEATYESQTLKNYLYLNGVQSSDSPKTSTSARAITVGAQAFNIGARQQTVFLGADFYGGIYTNHLLTVSERSVVTNALGAKAGLTL